MKHTLLRKELYWEKLIDYYYEHVHWDEPGPPSIYEWLERDYNVESNLHSKCLHFENPRDVTLFKLRWS